MSMSSGRRRRQLTPEEKWEVFVEVISQQLTQRDAARKWGVDVSVVIKLRKLAKDAALAALGWAGIRPTPVAEALLNAAPAGPDLRPPAVPDGGAGAPRDRSGSAANPRVGAGQPGQRLVWAHPDRVFPATHAARHGSWSVSDEVHPLSFGKGDVLDQPAEGQLAGGGGQPGLLVREAVHVERELHVDLTQVGIAE